MAILVALRALQRLMRPGQEELRCAVIESGIEPGVESMTSVTGGRES
jgi:hypothetical protein